MESNNSDNEKLTPDDSQETEQATPAQATPAVEKRDADQTELATATKDDDVDFDVRPADTYLGPDYSPKKRPRPTALWLGVLMVAAIIGLTYYAFRSQPDPEPGYETAASQATASTNAAAVSDTQPPSLPEKAPDAADFSPTPEADAAATTSPTSLPATTSSSTPSAQARDERPAATAKATDSAKAGATTKTTTSAKASGSKNEAKTSSAKSTETKPAVTSTKPAENKADVTKATGSNTPATTAKPTEGKPATSEAKKSVEAKTDTAAAVSGETTQKTGETKQDEAKPEAARKPDENSGAGVASSTEAQPAPGTTTASVQATPATGSTTTAGEISNLWVVNISSTPDAAESIRLLNRVNTMDVGGQIYFYEATIDGRVHHRIRVGFFETRGEAEAVGQKVKDTLKLSATPWAVKPTVEEVERYKKKPD